MGGYIGRGTAIAYTDVAAGATGGGSNEAFWENDTTIYADYTIQANKNAVTAGPVTINDGITVTIPDGSTWTVI